MAIYGNLRDYKFNDNVDDIRGADVFGIDDEKLGSIADVIFDTNTGDMQYLVIDTGGWLASNRFVVPARQVMSNVEGEDHFRVNLTKEQVQRFPEYREEALASDERWNEYERRYVEAYKWDDTGDVLHRQGTTHAITPTAEEMPAGSGRGTGESLTPRGIAKEQPRFGATSSSDEAVANRPLGAGPGIDTAQFRDSEYRPELKIREDLEEAGKELRDDVRKSEASETMSRSEFLKDGTLRSEYDAPREEEFISEPAPVTYASRPPGTGKYGYATEARRFRDFQDRLRREREEIVRRREEERAA